MSLRPTQDGQVERARVFISYKRAEPDSALALALRDGLAMHHDVFIDKDIPTGAHWARRINQEIESADFFVVLLSRLSVRSEMVLGEIDAARELAAEREDERPYILPVRVAFQERLPFPLNAWFQFVNWTRWDTQDDTARVVAELLRSLAGTRPITTLPTDAPSLDRPFAGVESMLALPPTARHGEPPPKGALPLNSRHYVERGADRRLRTLLQREQCVTVSIRGPRQIGKTSLLARILREIRAQGRAVALIDFQLFEKSALADARTFYQQFCSRISHAVGLEPQIEQRWNDRLGDTFNCTRYLNEYVLPHTGGRLLLAMDEVDRVLESGFRSDFFGMLRSWHTHLDIVLVASTEPHLWIENPFESPFTVAERINLADFTPADVVALNQLYRSPLMQGQIRQLMKLVGGHPYLVHYAIYCVAEGIHNAKQLFARALADDGPFEDHLNHLLFRLYRKPELPEGMRQIVAKHSCRDERMYYRLNGAGLVRRDGDRVLPSRQLYADFFRRRLQSQASDWFGGLFSQVH